MCHSVTQTNRLAWRIASAMAVKAWAPPISTCSSRPSRGRGSYGVAIAA